MSESSKEYSVTPRSVISIIIFQFVFYGVIVGIVYWIITLNFTMLAISLLITLLQNFFIKGYSQGYLNFVVRYLGPQEYFKTTRHYEEEIPEGEKTMFTYHPHSIFCYGLLNNLNRNSFPNEKLSYSNHLGSRFMLYLPLIGMHFKFWGIQSVDPVNLKRLMSEGKDIALVPGGYEEATLTTPKELRVFIKNRKGFIKYALKYGYTIRPIIITNEHKAMQTFDGLKSIRLLANKLKMPGVIYWNKYGLLFPPGVHLHTLIGKGIKGKVYLKDESPSDEEIEQMHSKYMKEIERMYEEHKEKNGNTPLKFY